MSLKTSNTQKKEEEEEKGRSSVRVLRMTEGRYLGPPEAPPRRRGAPPRYLIPSNSTDHRRWSSRARQRVKSCSCCSTCCYFVICRGLNCSFKLYKNGTINFQTGRISDLGRISLFLPPATVVPSLPSINQNFKKEQATHNPKIRKLGVCKIRKNWSNSPILSKSVKKWILNYNWIEFRSIFQNPNWIYRLADFKIFNWITSRSNSI